MSQTVKAGRARLARCRIGQGLSLRSFEVQSVTRVGSGWHTHRSGAVRSGVVNVGK